MELKPCVSCDALVQERQSFPYPGHKPDCALRLEWIEDHRSRCLRCGSEIIENVVFHLRELIRYEVISLSKGAEILGIPVCVFRDWLIDNQEKNPVDIKSILDNFNKDNCAKNDVILVKCIETILEMEKKIKELKGV